MSADQRVFAQMLEEGVKPSAASDGSFAMDAPLHRALESYAVSCKLLPLPSGGKRKAPRNDTETPPPPKHQASKRSGKGKDGKGMSSKGNPKNPENRPAIPHKLRLMGGKFATAKSGKSLCYGFNLEGCPLGDQCLREHACVQNASALTPYQTVPVVQLIDFLSGMGRFRPVKALPQVTSSCKTAVLCLRLKTSQLAALVGHPSLART